MVGFGNGDSIVSGLGFDGGVESVVGFWWWVSMMGFVGGLIFVVVIWWLLGGFRWWFWVLVGFHDGDQVWVTMEIMFKHGSQWRSSLGFNSISTFGRLGFNSGGGRCEEW
ncbi:hypothetical protein SO802_006593 [Lithocarpus litseifolius]|uniref:Transmembrane protein n=1 Tax=Lithocarpus litseifolius TaxID=425828 RepID=A0AAW2DQI7_9ROSI